MSREGGEIVKAVALAGDGQAFAWGDLSGTVVCYDATNEKVAKRKFDGSRIKSLAFCSDQKSLVVLGLRGRLTIWDYTHDTVRELCKQDDKYGRIMCHSFDPDNNRVLFSVSADRTVRKWKLDEHKEPAPLTKMDYAKLSAVVSVGVSVKGNVYVTGHWDGSVKLWDLNTGQELRKDKHPGLTCVALSATGNTIASASKDGTIKVWDRQTGDEKATLRGHTQGVTSFVISADGQVLVSASADKTLRVWDLTTGQERAIFRGHDASVTAADLSPDGKLLLSGSADKTVKLWDAEKNSGFSLIKGTKNSHVYSAVFAPDGNTLVFGGKARGIEHVKLWSFVTGEMKNLSGEAGMVMYLAVGPDGTLATGGSAAKKWDVKIGIKPIPFERRSEFVGAIAISPDGRILAGADVDGMVTLWNLENCKILRVLGKRGLRVNSVAFSPDGNILAAARGNKVMLWDVDKVRLLRELAGHEGEVRAVAFTPDGKTVVSGGDDGTLRVWDVEKGAERCRPLRGLDESIISVACAPGGKTVVTGGNVGNVGTVRLWDLTPGQERERLTLHESHSPVRSVAIAMDGRRLAAVCDDGNLLLWESVEGPQLMAVGK
jgi:WD40 repeat protein